MSNPAAAQAAKTATGAQPSQRLVHFTLDGFQGYRSRFDDLKLVQELLEELPSVLKLDPVMPPFLLPYYNGVIPEDCGISAFVLLKGGHLTLHTFSFRECFFADLVYPGPVDVTRAQLMFQNSFPCGSVVAQTVERGTGSDPHGHRSSIAPIDTKRDFGPHLFAHFRPYAGPATMDDLFDVFDSLPGKVGMTPIMRPCIVKTQVAGGAPLLSAMTMIAESHVSLHVFPDTGEAFFDLFSCRFFKSEDVLPTLFQELGGNVESDLLLARGSRYKQLRTERHDTGVTGSNWLRAVQPEG